MTVLLDENMPRKLKWRLIERDLEVVTVPERGWVVVTMDQGIEHQQEVAGRDLALVVIEAPNNEYETLLPLISDVVEMVRQARAGTVVSVAA